MIPRYLITNDYITDIHQDQLFELIYDSNVDNTNDKILLKAEKRAEAEISGYLNMRYDMNVEFSPTTLWELNKTYNGDDLVYINAASYSATYSYTINDLTNYNRNIYICNTASTTATFSISDWNIIGYEYDMFYSKLPANYFDIENNYDTNDVVFWQNATWSCVQPTNVLNKTQIYQYQNLSSIPPKNVIPDAKLNINQDFWSFGGTYSVPGGASPSILPTDSTYWIEGDNRNQMILLRYIDIVLYHLHKTISPRNIPELRVKNYKDALNYLDELAKGNINIEMDEKQKNRLLNFRAGGSTGLDWNY